MKAFLIILACTIGLAARGVDAQIFVSATINQQPVRLIFDTGASDPVLFRRTAERLKLKVTEPPSDAKALPGQVLGGLTEPFDLALLNTSEKAVFRVVDVPKEVLREIDGALSWYPLKNKVLFFQLAKRNLDIRDTLPEGVTNWAKFKLQPDSRILGFELPGQDPEHNCIYVDTGAAAGVQLNPVLWEKFTASRTNEPATISASYTPGAGLVVKKEMWAGELSLGPVTLADVAVREEVPELARGLMPHHAATLGFFALRRLDLVLDGPNGVVYIHPRKEPVAEYPHNRLGAVFVPRNMQSDQLLAHVIFGTPAALAGIRDGDVLLKIDDLDVTKWRTDPRVLPMSQFWEQSAGTTLQLTLKRGEQEYQAKIVLKDILGVPAQPLPVYSNVPREVEAAQGLIGQILRSELPQFQTRTNNRPNALMTYDLMRASDEVMKKIIRSPEFAAYVKQRKDALSPEEIKSLDSKTKGKWMTEYAQSRENVKPEIKAWLSFMASLSGSWDQALADYHRLEQYRPKDVVPVFMLAAKSAESDSLTTEQWQELNGILHQVLPSARNVEEMADCVIAIAAGAMRTSELRDGQVVPFEMVWSWMRDVQLPEAAMFYDTVVRFNLAKMSFAMGAKDYMAAAELAPRCRLRIFQPMWLVCAGKQEEAYEILTRLRQDASLTEIERKGLQKLEPLILMFAHRFEEAREALGAIQQGQKLTIKDFNWIETMKSILGNLEASGRNRSNDKQP